MVADRRSVLAGSVAEGGLAILAGAAAVAGSYAVAGLTPAFVAGPIAGVLARTLPAAIVTFAIVALGDLGATINLVAALVIAAGLLAVASFIGLVLGRTRGPWVGAPLTAGLVWIVATTLTGTPMAALGAGIAAGLVVAVGGHIESGSTPSAEVSPDRRRLLAAAATALLAGLVGVLIQQGPAAIPGDRGGPNRDTDVESTGPPPDARVTALLDDAAAKSLDVENLEPLVSESFYQVDINAANPTIDAEEWTLSVTGAVEQEITMGYDELRARPEEHRSNTLRCVGESLNGRKMDNALWTGTPVADLVARAAPTSGC